MRLVPVLALTLALLGFAAAPPPAVDYRVSPVMEGDALAAVAIEMTLQGDADGETVLVLPDNWGGKPALWKHLDRLVIEGGQARADGPARQIVRHEPGRLLTVRWRVKSGYPGEPTPEEGNPYRPVIRPGWFQLLGNATFIEPEKRESAPARVTWTGWPKTWVLASDLDHQRMGRPLMVGDVIESISVGGTDLKVYSRPIDGGTLRFAVRGDWDFEPEALADQLARVLSAQRRFWGDTREPFFVSLTPMTAPQGWRSSGGTGRTDGFAMFSTREVGLPSLRFTLSHEHMHSWLPRRTAFMPDPEQGHYWFSEGFTDFYALRTLLRSGVFSLEDYRDKLNELLARHDSSPAKAWPNSRIVEGFWTDRLAQDLPYNRGMLIAYLWDARVRAATGGAKDLDDVILAVRDGYRSAKGPKPTPAQGLTAAMQAVAGIDIGLDLARLVEAGEPAVLPPDLFGNCGTLLSDERADFELGWDRDATGKTMIITGLATDTPAYAAGLRDGMKVIRVLGGRNGDATVPFVLLVQDGEAEREIRFMPEGKRRFTVRRMALTPGLDATGRERCRRLLSGI